MPRGYPNAITIEDQHVGYSLNKLAGERTYIVFFQDAAGRRLKRDTKQTSNAKAIEAAKAIIASEYAPTLQSVSWAEAMRQLREKAIANGLRETTLGFYDRLANCLRKSKPDVSPTEFTTEMAEKWKQEYSAGETRRGKLPSPHTVSTLVRGFRSLWSWFSEELNICETNPWKEVEPPRTDKLDVKVISNETLTNFLGWIDKRYSGWELPKLFLETKAVTGCRLMDLCSLESSQLKDGRLHFRPDQTKGRKARSVPLPDDIAKRLEAIKGPNYLWQTYPNGLVAAVKKMGCPTHTIKPDFRPARLYHWIETLFLDYGAEFPGEPPIHSHQLRKRAFTAAWAANVDPRRAAVAYGCNVETVMNHYVALDEQAVIDEVTGQLAEILKPKK